MIYYIKSSLFHSFLSKSSKTVNSNDSVIDKNNSKLTTNLNNIGGNVFGGSA